VDILGAIRSSPLIDLVLLLFLCGSLFLGVLQGAIRRLLGIGANLVAFVLAANLRDPVGDFLSRNWVQFGLGYDRLLAFVIIFVVACVAASIATEAFYKRVDISAEHPIADDVVGGLLGLAQGFLLLLMVAIIFNSYTLPTALPGDLTPVRDVQNLIQQSHIAGALNDHVAPLFVHVLGPLLPSDLVSIFP